MRGREKERNGNRERWIHADKEAGVRETYIYTYVIYVPIFDISVNLYQP